MTTSQSDKAARFRALHEEPGAFVVPNPWDAGSARLLAGLGFQALATSSGASAGILGRRDGTVAREEALAQARAHRLGNRLAGLGRSGEGLWRRASGGGGDHPACREVGPGRRLNRGCHRRQAKPLYDIEPATERVAAAVQAARALPFPFTLTARAENFLRGNPNLDDTIKRLQAFEQAGADVLFAPGLPDLAAVRAVCAAVSKPVNFMVGIPGKSFTVAELVAVGVRRISLATSLYRAAMSGLLNAAREVQDRGTFGYLDHAHDHAGAERLHAGVRQCLIATASACAADRGWREAPHTA